MKISFRKIILVYPAIFTKKNKNRDLAFRMVSVFNMNALWYDKRINSIPGTSRVITHNTNR